MMPSRPVPLLDAWLLCFVVGIFGTAAGLMFLIVVKQFFELGNFA